MEDKSDIVTNNHALQSLLVQQTLNSWRFFLLFSAPPMVWVIFAAPVDLLRVLITLLCGIVWFGCWRLWLDARYFRLINEENNHQAGEALCVIRQRDRLKTLSLSERQQGALKQCRRAMFFTGALWVVWLVALL